MTAPPKGRIIISPVRVQILPLEGVRLAVAKQKRTGGRVFWCIRNNELIPENCLPHEVLTKCGHSEQTTVCVGI